MVVAAQPSSPALSPPLDPPNHPITDRLYSAPTPHLPPEFSCRRCTLAKTKPVVCIKSPWGGGCFYCHQAGYPNTCTLVDPSGGEDKIKRPRKDKFVQRAGWESRWKPCPRGQVITKPTSKKGQQQWRKAGKVLYWVGEDDPNNVLEDELPVVPPLPGTTPSPMLGRSSEQFGTPPNAERPAKRLRLECLPCTPPPTSDRIAQADDAPALRWPETPTGIPTASYVSPVAVADYFAPEPTPRDAASDVLWTAWNVVRALEDASGSDEQGATLKKVISVFGRAITDALTHFPG